MRSLLLTAILAVFVAPLAAAEPTIKVSAGAAPLENIFIKIKPRFEAETGIKLELKKATHVTSLQDVESGNADLAVVGFEFEDWIKRAEKDGAKINRADLKHRVIGGDNLVFITHKGVGKTTLTNEQLRKIFVGESKSWSEFGVGKDKIIPLIAEDLPGLNGLVKEKILGGSDFTATKVKGSVQELKAALKKTPGAIAFVPTGALESEVEKIETDHLGRPLTAVNKGKPSAELFKLFDFIAKNK